MNGDVISYVNISNVDQEDGGLYRCEARNEAGSVHHSEQVYIVGSPFIKPLGNITVQAGDTLTIRCPVTGYPIQRITWSKGDLILLLLFSPLSFILIFSLVSWDLHPSK